MTCVWIAAFVGLGAEEADTLWWATYRQEKGLDVGQARPTKGTAEYAGWQAWVRASRKKHTPKRHMLSCVHKVCFVQHSVWLLIGMGQFGLIVLVLPGFTTRGFASTEYSSRFASAEKDIAEELEGLSAEYDIEARFRAGRRSLLGLCLWVGLPMTDIRRFLRAISDSEQSTEAQERWEEGHEDVELPAQAMEIDG